MKVKHSLAQLKVDSFITALNQQEQVKGGKLHPIITVRLAENTGNGD